MATKSKIAAAVLGASGYTGADLIRLAARHPGVEIKALIARSHAGQPLGKVFPHLGILGLPNLVTAGEVDWNSIDIVFCGLPHAAAHQEIAKLPKTVKIIDMSADFRLRDPDVYAQWYSGEHGAQDMLAGAVYGLTEHYRDQIRDASLVACPGCYPTAILLAMLPLVKAGQIDANGIIVDAKSGLTGAGRSLKQNTLFAEAGEGLSPYGIGAHRHIPELEQEIGLAADQTVRINFTPHLAPMARGELCTCYVVLKDDATVASLRNALQEAYAGAPFVQLLEEGDIPATQNVRGSNYCQIGVFTDRIEGRAIVIAAIDNLVKGSAGQALQNFNLMFGFDETEGLQQLPLFP